MVDPTEEQRWITVDGRRWRATDPSIPATLRSELVGELMAARRAVAAAKGDAEAIAAARARVQQAKVALGERGEPWWEPTDAGVRTRIEAAILTLATRRSPKSTCPSDAARAVGGDGWRTLMATAREGAAELAAAGRIRITQRGLPVAADQPGPIRLSLADE